MQFLNRLSIRSKLYAGFAVVSAALLVAVAVGWISMLSVSSALRPGFEKAVDAEATSKWAYNMRVSQVQSAALGHAIKNADGSDMHTSDVAAYIKSFTRLAADAASPEDRAAIRAISAAHTRWEALDRKVVALWKVGHRRAALALANGAANTAGDALSTALDTYADRAKADAERNKASASRQAEYLMGVFVVVALALAVAIAALLARRIGGGLASVQERLNSLTDHCLADTEHALTAMATQGDITIEIVPVTEPVEVKGKDEIAQLTATFNTMLAKARSSIDAYEAMRSERVMFADIIERGAAGGLSSQMRAASEKDR